MLFDCTDPHLVLAGLGETNKNITKKFKEKVRPSLAHLFNSSMGFVDEYDHKLQNIHLLSAWTKKT